MKQKLDYKNIFESSLIVIVSILVYQIMKGFQANFFLVDDNYTQFAPIIQEAFSEFFHTGEMPIYDFYQMKGMAIADVGYYSLTNGGMLFAYLFTKVCSVWNVLEVYILLCVCSGNLAMNYLLKRLQFQTVLRMFLLVIYTTCTAFLYFGYWYHIYGNYVAVPCLLLAVIKIFDAKQTKSDYVCAGIVLFFSCCLGNIQYTFYHYVLFAVLSALLIWIMKKPHYMKAVAYNLLTAVLLSSPYLVMSMQAGKRRSMHVALEEFLLFPNPIIRQVVLSFIPMPLFQKIFGQTQWYEDFIRQESFSANGYWYYCGIPVLFHRDLLKEFDQPPYNFSIELYTYWKAKKHGFVIKRAPLRFENRKHGTSSWNKGLRSKMKLSIQMICDSVKIRIGSFKEK